MVGPRRFAAITEETDMEQLDFTEGARVIGSDGATIGTLVTVDTASQPPSLVVRLAESGQTAGIPVARVDLARSTADEIVLHLAGADLLASVEPIEERGEGRLTIPLAAEELVPRRREVRKGRVLIHKRVETSPVEEEIEVEHEVVDIERVPVGRDVDEVPPVRQEGDTMIVPVVEEVLVIEKRLSLVEEVRITKRRVAETETVSDELRREVIDVEEERMDERS
jgi:uncharacterized protein (TIGR02271 family)